MIVGVAGPARTATRSPATPAAPPPSDGAALDGATRSHSFEWFSSLPAYRAMNRSQLEALFDDLNRPWPLTGVDVACGLGLMTELCHDIAAQRGTGIERVLCVDLDPEVLHLARAHLAALPALPAHFLRSLGQRLPQRGATADFVVVGNGIHNFADEDKLALLREAFRVLRPGGRVFFNSSFYDGAVVEGSERYWLENVRAALRLIVRRSPQDRTPGEAPDRKPEAMRMLTSDDYVAIVRNAGFVDVQSRVAELRFDRELMEAICDYWLYSQGALHFRYPAAVACDAMRQAAHALFADPEWERKYPGMVDGAGQRYIPRRVLWVTARKPATGGAPVEPEP
jgi:ubiquinone/menaquinone biosynthesis C-methylase UbiE